MNIPAALVLFCPSCETGQLALESMSSRTVACHDCDASFPIKNGIIDLLPAPSRTRTLSQSVMEWQRFIDIYESAWFRTGPIYSFFAGISFRQEYEMIIEAANLNGDEMLLDLGCGSGIYSRPLARRLRHGAVVGFDLSMPMLMHASARARVLGIENLLFIHGNALELPFPDNHFDAANCTATIHLFSPKQLLKILREVYRTLKPGARFTTSCLRNILSGERSKRFYDWYSPKVGTYYRRVKDLEPLFEEAGFTDIRCHHAKRYWQVLSMMKAE